jgi:hypothetical protein
VPPSRWSRIRRRLVVVVSVAVLVPLVGLPASRAEEDVSTGDTVTGEFVQMWQEFEDPRDADARADDALLSFVRTEAGESVRVATDEVENLPVGATVELTVGDTLADAAAVQDGYEPAHEVLAAEVVEAAPAEPGPTSPATVSLDLEVTVVMVAPPGAVPDGTTVQEVVDAVNGPVNDFWREQGHKRIGVVASHDWMTTEADCSDPYALWDEVAGDVGFVRTHRAHLLLYVSDAPADLECSYGLAEVTSTTVDGGYAYVRDTETSLIAHELGHNLTLRHSSARQCDRTVETGTCQTEAYADYYDVMGYSWGPIGSLNMAHASSLPGVLEQWDRRSIYPSSPPSTVTLVPVSQPTGVRGLELMGGPGRIYWLEYRTAAGRDAWLATDDNWMGLQTGVQLRTKPGSGSDASLLLDGTPSARAAWNGDYQTALPIGTPIRLASGDFVITVVSVDAASATIHVEPVGLGPAGPPIGSLDGVSLSGPTVSVHGWAIDLNTPVRTLDVRVTVDGRASVVAAGASRADIGRVYPVAGSRHGFSFSAPVTPGSHTVCAHALDSSGFGSTALGCRVVTYVPAPPIGTLDQVALSGPKLTVGGWALDTDTPTQAAQVHLYLDGRAVALTANRARADVGRAHPTAGSAHGFTFTTTVTPGSHRVCAYAIDTGGRGSTALGCRTVTYVPQLPKGSLDGVTVSAGTLSVAGWALDTDTPSVSGRVHVYVGTRGAALTANLPRADIGRAFPGAGNAHGFAFSTAVPRGSHRVCAYAIDTGGRGSVLLGCRTVTA